MKANNVLLAFLLFLHLFVPNSLPGGPPEGCPSFADSAGFLKSNVSKAMFAHCKPITMESIGMTNPASDLLE